MATRSFIDTNFLIYAEASDAPVKQRLALDLHQTRSIAFSDAIIVATAQTAGCDVVLSEEMNAGESPGGVRIVNPFAAG